MTVTALLGFRLYAWLSVQQEQLRIRQQASLLVSASAGVDIYKSERMNMHFQVDGQNLTNVLNVIDFGGLFSGNAIGPGRSATMRLTTSF